MTVHDAAIEYLGQRWLCVPVPYRKKSPTLKEWQHLRLDTAEKIAAHFNGTLQNIGILLGEPSDGLIDIDLDSPNAIAVAPWFLPQTRIFGRTGKPNSHWEFRVDPIPSTRKFQFRNVTIVEIRSTGAQTIFPGSCHEATGEPIEWFNHHTLAQITGEDLSGRVSRLAAAALLASAWPTTHGCRDALAMALAGGLLRAEWPPEEVERFMEAVCKSANDEEWPARVKQVRQTLQKLNQSQKVTGWQRLSELLEDGEERIKRVKAWLGIRHSTPPLAESTEHLNLTDYGNAERLVHQYGERLRYVHAWKKWLVWDNIRWVADQDAEVMRLAKETVRQIYAEASNCQRLLDREAIAKHAVKSEAEGRLSAIICLAESERAIAIVPDLLDTHSMLLNCRNGTLDLATGQLSQHRKEDLITKAVSVSYDPKALCPTWERLLDEIMAGNGALIDFLQRALGYTLTGSIEEQCLFVFYGDGANGKSTVLETKRALLGPYAGNLPIEALLVTEKKSYSGQPNNDIAALKGTRFVTATECNEGQDLNVALIKQLTGGEPITARFLYGEFFTYRPEFKLFMATNHKPIIRGTDYGAWRRIYLVPFNVTIPAERQDKHLPEKLKTELPGILAWSVRGCQEWRRHGLCPPDEVVAATKNYRSEMDIVGRFVSERCILQATLETPASNLFRAFQAWCAETGERVITQQMFGRQLSKRGLQSRPTRSGNSWGGIGLGCERCE
ncbi:MAG: phage/plasmid primase, P4 family [Acidobacteria bacterium]|nr:phage/plasmid primase, P4 family [Acidobacteriota bacterium]MCI0718131.1 phage/plasmid primase, P4 family [Acidobacteriota bacterium]